MATLVAHTDWAHPKSGGTSFNVPIPTPTAGHTLVFCSAGGAISTPTGFTRAPDAPYGGGAQDVSIWFKTATGSETSVAVSLNGSGDNVGGTILEFSGTLTYNTGSNNGAGSTISQSSDYQVAPAAVSVSAQSLVIGLWSVAQSTVFSTSNQFRQMGPAGRIVTSAAEQDASGPTKVIYAVGIADVDASHQWPFSASPGSYAATSVYQGSAPGTAFAAQAVFTDTSGTATVTWPNNIVRENSLPGTDTGNWYVNTNGTDSTIAGFPTTPSVQPGSTVSFKVDSTNSPFRAEIYRLGWYGFDTFGARRVAQVTGTATAQPTPTVDGTLGSTSCAGWTANASWSVPSDAVPGVYYVLFRRTDVTTHVASTHFVVRETSPSGKTAVVIPDLTHHAYSVWGATTDHGDRSTGTWTGRSLYQAGADGASPDFSHRSYAVCLDRPYSTQSTQAMTYLFDSEYGWIQFAEAQGFNLTYLSDMDLEGSTTLLNSAALVAMVGHHEYWTANIYTAFQNAVASGVNLFVYSSNTAGWRVRFAAGDTNKRTAICYKDSGTRDVSPGFTGTGYDPVTPTGTWRDASPTNGVNNPDRRLENALTGQRFVASGPVQTPMLVDASFKAKPIWRNSASVQALTTGTHFTDISNSIGYEVDSADGSTGQPSNLTTVASTSTAVTTGSNAAGTVYSTATSVNATWTLHRDATAGALVFNTGNWRAWWSCSRYQGSSPVASVSVDMQNALLSILFDLGQAPHSLTALQPGVDTTPTDPSIGAPAAGNGNVAIAYGLTASTALTGAATLSGTGTLTVAGAVQEAASANLSATGTLTVSGARTALAGASLAGTATLAANVSTNVLGAVSFTGAGSLSATINLGQFAAVSCTASGVLSVSSGLSGTVWQLVPPTETITVPVRGLLRWSLTIPYTVYGDDSGLHSSINGDADIPFNTKYVWIGGHVNTTEDPAIRDLWLANGFEVEEVAANV